VREAMQRLAAEGLLRSERHRGIFVRDLDDEYVRDVYRARLAVEQAAGRLILRGDTTRAEGMLTASLDDLEVVARVGDPVTLADADQTFHSVLVAARLRRMADGLLVETRMCLAALQITTPPPDELVAEHQLLRCAVRAAAEHLAAVLEMHMSDAVDRILGASGSPAPAASVAG